VVCSRNLAEYYLAAITLLKFGGFTAADKNSADTAIGGG